MPIERFKGFKVPGYFGVPPGGGSGSTEQEAIVAKAAAAMEKAFGGKVQIRFNADGLSGGAWLCTRPVPTWAKPGNTWEAHTGVGICTTQDPKKETRIYTCVRFKNAVKKLHAPPRPDFTSFVDVYFAVDAGMTEAVRIIRKYVRPEHLDPKTR